MSDVMAKITAQIGMDPERLIAERREIMEKLAELEDRYSQLDGFYRGGTASAYDHKRKAVLSKIAKKWREEESESRVGKVTEREIEEAAHAHPDYHAFLEAGRNDLNELARLKGEKARLLAAKEEIDEWLAMVRAMIYWNTQEMKIL
jgi:hypothetical protein